MSKSKATLAEEAREQQEAREKLWTMISSNRPDALYTVLMRHTDTTRVIRVLLPEIYEGRPCVSDISRRVARITGRRYSERWEGVICHGGGMDMGWDLIYTLGRALRRDAAPTGTDAGYDLRHRWL